MKSRLEELVRQAWETGQQIDLGRAAYGRAMRDNQEIWIKSPSTYYPFLAGLVRAIGARTVIEIGTNCGGSALAMAAGMSSAGRIVTIDISDFSDPYLREHPSIRKIEGDANSIEVIEATLAAVGTDTVDLVYIDAAHSCLPTLLNYCIYGALFRPRLVAIDDITLYQTMTRMWDIVLGRRNVAAVNAAEIIPAIRPQQPAPGFGVVAFTEEFVGDETVAPSDVQRAAV